MPGPYRRFFALACGAVLLYVAVVWAEARVHDVHRLRATVAEQYRQIVDLSNQAAELTAANRQLLEQINEIEWGTRVTDSPEKAVVAFMDAYKNRSGTLARFYLTDRVREQVPMRPLGQENPFISRYQLLTPTQPAVNQDSVQFTVRVFEEFTGRGEIGYFDLSLMVIQSNYRFLIDGIKQGQYVQVRPRTETE